MNKKTYGISVDSEKQYKKIQTLLRMNRMALDTLFMYELGHPCQMSDSEIIADALEQQLYVTKSSIGVILSQKAMER